MGTASSSLPDGHTTSNQPSQSAVERDKQRKRQASHWLIALARPVRFWLILTVAIGLVSGLLLILQAYLLAHIAYAAYLHHLTRSTLVSYFIALLGSMTLRAIFVGLKEVVSFQTSARVRSQLRQQIIRHISRLGPAAVNHHSVSAFTAAAMEQVEGLNDFLVYYLPQMSLAVLLPLAILIAILPLSLTSAIILLICAPLIPFFMALVGMGAASLQQKHFQSLAIMSHHFLDSIQGLITLKLLGKSKQQAEKIATASENYRHKTMAVLKVAFMSSAVLEVFAAASIALLAIYLGMGFINVGTNNHLYWSLHQLTLQGALFILLLAPEFFLPLRELGTHYHARAKAIAAALEIRNIFDLAVSDNQQQFSAATKETITNKQLFAEGIHLHCDNLSLSYHNAQTPALKNIEFSIAMGEKVAIVGASGAGKSSLFNLLLKFITPSDGHIWVNGNDLNSIDENNWYHAIAWLGQQPHLFHGTIRENLQLAQSHASEQQMMAALQQAHFAQQLLAFPQGLDTIIGENRSGLSGGQAQRLALARIYLRDSSLLLLDEPTAALDAEHQQTVIRSLSNYWQSKTVLLLTHRWEWLEQVDRVLVLDQGMLVQEGKLETLMADHSGLFYQLYGDNKDCQQ